MVLNYIWIGLFLIAFIVALIELIFTGNTEIFPAIIKGIFNSAETGFTISIGLTGVLSLWMGIMKIGEDGGAIKIFSRIVNPFFRQLFPELGKNHPAYGSIMMNVAANMLGLDNAATPLGLKAMEQMQESNPSKDQASNAQIMFLVLNTSGLTVIPVSVMVYRAQMGAADPSDIFLPILLATLVSTIVGIIAVSIVQKINLLTPVILAWFVTVVGWAGYLTYFLNSLPKEKMELVSSIASNVILFSIIIGFILLGAFKRINVYDSFVEGAKGGFQIAIKIIPFLIAILVAIGAFKASGAMSMFTDAISDILSYIGLRTDFVEAIPTALMKPLSGSGARGMMIECMGTHGADSFPGRVASVLQGATDTTFYIIAVYFGSVGIKNTRHSIPCGLIADAAGIIAAIFLSYLFFG